MSLGACSMFERRVLVGGGRYSWMSITWGVSEVVRAGGAAGVGVSVVLVGGEGSVGVVVSGAVA